MELGGGGGGGGGVHTLAGTHLGEGGQAGEEAAEHAQ